MSCGFGIGDFIAVGELAHRLFTDIYLVARGAPEELRMLNSELGMLDLSINLLVEQMKKEDSTLVQAGESKMCMVGGIMKQANATLKDLQLLTSK